MLWFSNMEAPFVDDQGRAGASCDSLRPFNAALGADSLQADAASLAEEKGIV